MRTTTMKQISILSSLLLCAVVVTMAQNAPENKDQENRLLILEHLWNDAQVHRDPRALEGMIGDRFEDTEYDGEVSDRAKFLADIDNPKYKPAELSISDVKVNLYRDTAVVFGAYHIRGSYNNQPYEHTGRFTDTWIYDGGKWLCVASHSSLLKK